MVKQTITITIKEIYPITRKDARKYIQCKYCKTSYDKHIKLFMMVTCWGISSKVYSEYYHIYTQEELNERLTKFKEVKKV